MNKKDIWICSLLGLGALIMRMLLISKGPFSPESLNLALKAEQTVDTLQLQYMFGTGYPLTMIITAAAVFVGRFLGLDDPVLAANLMSVYASALSIPLFYLLVKRLIDVPTAVIAALLLAVSPIYLGISVYAKGHALELIFAFGGMLMLLNYAQRRSANALFLSAILFGCLGGVRVQDLAFIAPAAAYLMFFWTTNKEQRLRDTVADACIFAVAVTAITVGFHLPYVLGAERAAYFAQLQMFRGLSFTAQHSQSWFASWPFYREWFLTNFTGFGLLAAGIGLVLAWRRQWRTALFALIWFVVPFGFYLVIDTTIPRLFVILLPPVIIFAAFFLAYGYRRQGKAAAALGTAIAVLLAGTMFFKIYSVLKFRHHRAVVPEYVAWVRAQVPSNARVICKDDFIFYEHYGNFTTLKRPNPGSGLEKIRLYRHQLRDLLAAGVPVYVSGVGLYSYDPGRQVSGYLKQYFDFVEIGRHPYEIWHAGELQIKVFEDPLFRVMLK